MLGCDSAPDVLLPPSSLKLVEEINHRVVNEYAEAIATLSLAASRVEDPAAQAVLARAAARLHDHAESHRALMPPAVDGEADLGDHVARICDAFTRATLAERDVHLGVRTVEIRLAAERCWRIGLVLVELIRNAARHGLRGSGGLISVEVSEQSGLLTCEVRDNGRPPSRAIPGRGQGLIRALVAELGGGVEWIFTEGGAIARVQLPVREDADCLTLTRNSLKSS
ncbi:ATP-binding protein [Sphingosinicella sp. BN140058]|uniref:ATP-binding protein n=1 Tax=Sphingosinicella sp. BN140058 TaxID=1892855 RepID=UPI001013A740|nr:ATP-binding protein [Sphingosinicella sp. BN140058]QAY79062.1 sensor histidine kinase [Sphingosinicella sp. BN140058]